MDTPTTPPAPARSAAALHALDFATVEELTASLAAMPGHEAAHALREGVIVELFPRVHEGLPATDADGEHHRPRAFFVGTDVARLHVAAAAEGYGGKLGDEEDLRAWVAVSTSPETAHTLELDLLADKIERGEVSANVERDRRRGFSTLFSLLRLSGGPGVYPVEDRAVSGYKRGDDPETAFDFSRPATFADPAQYAAHLPAQTARMAASFLLGRVRYRGEVVSVPSASVTADGHTLAADLLRSVRASAARAVQSFAKLQASIPTVSAEPPEKVRPAPIVYTVELQRVQRVLRRLAAVESAIGNGDQSDERLAFALLAAFVPADAGTEENPYDFKWQRERTRELPRFAAYLAACVSAVDDASARLRALPWRDLPEPVGDA